MFWFLQAGERLGNRALMDGGAGEVGSELIIDSIVEIDKFRGSFENIIYIKKHFSCLTSVSLKIENSSSLFVVSFVST